MLHKRKSSILFYDNYENYQFNLILYCCKRNVLKIKSEFFKSKAVKNERKRKNLKSDL